MFAKIILSQQSMPTDETFDYSIPETLVDFIDIGSRVIVPFGFQEVVGFVVALHEVSDFLGNIKPIKEVLGFEKELTLEQMQLAKQLSENLHAGYGYMLELMLPSFLRERRKKYIFVENPKDIDANLSIILGGKKKVLFDEQLRVHYPLIKQEIAKKNIVINYDFANYGAKKKVKLFSLENDGHIKSNKQQLVVDYITNHDDATLDAICDATNVSEYLVKKMVKDKVLRTKDVWMAPLSNQEPVLKSKITFNFDQKQLIEKFHESKGKPFLLFSKDDVFKINFVIDLIIHYAKLNKKTVIFAPSIILVEEITRYLKTYINGITIHSYHSKNMTSDNYDCFMDVKNDNYTVLVSTPMGVFLPFDSVGLFFVFDEENPQYIYENYPYYHSIEVLKIRTETIGAKLILASSSPSINSYYATQMYHMFLLEYHSFKKNNTLIVDMKEAVLEESNRIISQTLHDHIKKSLSTEDIVMLIVNNKAYATQIKCRTCGEVLSCPKCKMPLMYLDNKKQAKCNYCDYKTENYHTCSCGSEQMMMMGFGLEQVAKTIAMTYPKARIMQIDADIVRSIEDIHDVLAAIEEKSVDIIIGTNLLSKTFLNDAISVVGLLQADSYLYLNDHRASEFTYSLIAKMVNKPICIIQTYNKDHYAIVAGAKQDYDMFYAKEIAIREMMDYEPFFEVNRITITGPYNKMFHFANYYRKAIRHMIGDRILGPSYDYKVHGVKLIIKHNQFSEVIKVLQDAIKNFNVPELRISFERYSREM